MGQCNGSIASLGPSTYRQKYASGPRSLRPCHGKARVSARAGLGGCDEAFLNILHGIRSGSRFFVCPGLHRVGKGFFNTLLALFPGYVNLLPVTYCPSLPDSHAIGGTSPIALEGSTGPRRETAAWGQLHWTRNYFRIKAKTAFAHPASGQSQSSSDPRARQPAGGRCWQEPTNGYRAYSLPNDSQIHFPGS